VDKILIIQTAFLGDVVLATPVIEKLHGVFPEAKIDFLLRNGNEGILKGHPFLKEIIILNKQKNKYQNVFKVIKQIRGNKYDIILNLHRFGSSGFITVLSKVKHTIGFDKNPFSIFFSKRVKHVIGKKVSNIHEIDRNLSLTDEYGDKMRIMPRIYPSDDDYKKTESLKKSTYICIAPCSVWFTKQYPKEKWLEFIRIIPEHIFIYLIGSENDSELCNEIIMEAGRKNIYNEADKLNMLETAALMKNSIMNFVNDSAPLHFASAMNAPVTAIYCSTVPDFGFGPLSDNSHIIQTVEQLDCRPCGLHGFKSCPENHYECAHSINSENLLKVILN